ncbi:MAG: phage portal protein [Variovorax sp.]
MKRIIGAFSGESYPFPPGSQNRDGFERNADNPMLLLRDERQLAISTVWACVRLISGTISTLPLNLYERQEKGRRFASGQDLYTILHDVPNADMTAKVFWQAYVASMLLNGVAYAEKKVGTRGVVALDFLEYGRMRESVVNGERLYRYTDRDGTSRLIPRDRLFRTIGFTLDGITGLSAIQYGARMFNSAQLADIAANRTFNNGLMPTTYFKYPKVMQKNQRAEAREMIKKISGALNAGDPAILEAEMDTGTIGINPNDAQLLESRAWSVEEICRWFGVPPFMVGHSEKSTSWGSGLEQQNIGFLTYCLRDHLKGIEQSIAKDILTPAQRRTLYAEFAIDALLRADSASRAAFYASAAQNGWMDRAEIRELENLPYREGSAVLTAQSNLLPLDKLGTEKSAPALQDALKNFLGIVEKAES